MKLYVAIVSYYREGYSEPIGVFSTKELALKAADSYDVSDGSKPSGGDAVVLEYELDVATEYKIDAITGLYGRAPQIDTAKDLRGKVFVCLNRSVEYKYDLSRFGRAYDIAVDLVTFANDCKDLTPDELVPHVEAWLAERKETTNV